MAGGVRNVVKNVQEHYYFGDVDYATRTCAEIVLQPGLTIRDDKTLPCHREWRTYRGSPCSHLENYPCYLTVALKTSLLPRTYDVFTPKPKVSKSTCYKVGSRMC